MWDFIWNGTHEPRWLEKLLSLSWFAIRILYLCFLPLFGVANHYVNVPVKERYPGKKKKKKKKNLDQKRLWRLVTVTLSMQFIYREALISGLIGGGLHCCGKPAMKKRGSCAQIITEGARDFLGQPVTSLSVVPTTVGVHSVIGFNSPGGFSLLAKRQNTGTT